MTHRHGSTGDPGARVSGYGPGRSRPGPNPPPSSPPGTGPGGGVLVNAVAVERVPVCFVSVRGVTVVVLGTPSGRALDLSEGVLR